MTSVASHRVPLASSTTSADVARRRRRGPRPARLVLHTFLVANAAAPKANPVTKPATKPVPNLVNKPVPHPVTKPAGPARLERKDAVRP